MATTAKLKEATAFATQLYDDQKDQIKRTYIETLATRLVQSIEQGEQDIKDGKVMTMADFEAQINAIKI